MPLPACLGASRSMPSTRSRPTASRASPATPAFSDLYYAIYLGRYETPSNLLTYDFSHLPPTGDTAKVTVPFGDSDITIVTAARGQLAGTLPALLPWIFGVLGLLLTWPPPGLAERLVRRRRSAERDADEIGRLYGELGTLYGEQRTDRRDAAAGAAACRDRPTSPASRSPCSTCPAPPAWRSVVTGTASSPLRAAVSRSSSVTSPVEG